MDPSRIYKEYNLYVMRAHFQVRAKQKMIGNELYMDKLQQDLDLYKNVSCMKTDEPEVKEVEKYKIQLNIKNPNLLDLYSQIREVCPEFSSKKSFHLYWKCSTTEILPISNHITYLSMVSYIADKNDNLFLIAREWDDSWLSDMAATYTATAEDKLLVNMVAPRQTIFTAFQEEKTKSVKAAAVTEFTRTYNPPEHEKRKSPPKERHLSPKSKSAKKK